jgi:hypothetical protein
MLPDVIAKTPKAAKKSGRTFSAWIEIAAIREAAARRPFVKDLPSEAPDLKRIRSVRDGALGNAHFG